MENSYKTVYKDGKDEISIKKSRFIGYGAPISNEDEALKFIEKIKSIHRDATHNVYAYVLGKDSNIQRFSDDGEPGGTAGIPALEVLKKEDLRNVVVVVTRYFGGTKLGVGGLIRAYTKGAKIGINASMIIEKVLHTKLKLRIDYTLYGILENYLLNKEIIIENIVYDDAVKITVFIRKDEEDSF
ncbi:MAG TPA: YigZ family protein, partial [Tissierellales bacterium]|nr:YigZ family protein [Tissierellales bacterium]